MSVQQKYLDFELKIDDLGAGRYRATVTEMPLGDGQSEVSNDFTLPYSDAELSRLLAVLRGQADVSASEQVQQARTFGETLFKTVFASEVYTVYFSSRDRARTAAGLRIKLFLENAGALADLPWEFLRDPQVDFLALSRGTPLIRHPRRLVIRPTPTFSLPLRVLVMVSSPKDLEPVDVQAEWQNLQAATAELRAQKRIELVLLEDATLRTLQRMLREGEYHVFHYIGHSMFDAASDEGMLALEDPYGEASSFPVRGEDLARELSEENSIRLVVLNSCQSAVEGRNDPFAGIASSIVARGIPAVIAMQDVISEQAARVFSDELYDAVAQGLPVDAAVSEARRAISHAAAGGVEWAIPVLYMRAPDGMLFDFEPRRAAWWRRPAVLAGIGGALVVLLIALGLVALSRGDQPTPTPAPQIDLLVDPLEFEVIPENPAPGKKAVIMVQVINNSRVPVGQFDYDLLEDVLDNTPDYRGQVSGMAPGDRTTIFIPHAFSWWGPFLPEVRIDVTSRVVETNEINNTGRRSVVTSSDPFEVKFTELPDGSSIAASLAVTRETYAAWGFHLEAVPNDDPACAGMVPWIVVDSAGTRSLGTGLPDDPAGCQNGGIAVVMDRAPVGGFLAQFAPQPGTTYTLVAFDKAGTELDRVSQQGAGGEGLSLSLAGGFPVPLAISRAVLTADGGAPLHIQWLELSDPSRTGRLTD